MVTKHNDVDRPFFLLLLLSSSLILPPPPSFSLFLPLSPSFSLLLPLQGFIDYIVGPSFEVCGDMLSLLLPCSSSSPGDQQPAHEVWTRHLHENRERWKAQCEKKGNPSHMQAQKNYWHIHTYSYFSYTHLHTPPCTHPHSSCTRTR